MRSLQAILSEKAAVLRVAILVLFGVLILRLFFLQVILGGNYRMLAERNRFQIFYRQAPRGNILDRTGFPLASNIGVFNLYFSPFLAADKLHELEVSEILGLKPEQLRKEIEKARVLKRTSLVAKQIAPIAAFRFLEKQKLYPEFFLASESLRYYSLGPAFSHILGYLTRIRSREAFDKLRDKGYRYDCWLGGYGLEEKFEDYLRGYDGAVLIEVDVHGRPLVGQIAPGPKKLASVSQQLVWEPTAGADLGLTVDHRLILTAHEALMKSPTGSGSVVGLDPRTGAVLVIDSTPGFDPNSYIRLALAETALKRTEFSRALSGLYPPGSVFKVITSVAALEKGLDPTRRFKCIGRFVLPGRTFKCWKQGGHGSCDFIEGILNSCDVYFYNAGLFAGAELINEWAAKFSLGRLVAIRDLPELSKPGFIPTRGKEGQKRATWYSGDVLNLAIGQGEILVTPLQLAALFALLANKGYLPEPYLVEDIRDFRAGPGASWKQKPRLSKAWKVDSVSEKTWGLLEAGLAAVVERGTARGVRIPGYAIYGKTGTAQNPLGQDHALFACYLKDAQGLPRLALSVVIDHGGQGSAAAIPVARRVIEQFIKIESDLAAQGSKGG